MLSRLFTIISLVVFLILLIEGSSVESALIKSALVFFAFVGCYIIIRFLIRIIGKSTTQDQESPGH
jgi:galactitol-specific phosphotransferase system IIC component